MVKSDIYLAIRSIDAVGSLWALGDARNVLKFKEEQFVKKIYLGNVGKFLEYIFFILFY